MADIRIKDLGTTASVTASDDFMAVDGTTNGTRKLSAAAPAFLTSVTTPSLTSPAATNLTLGLGTGGTALTLTNSTLAATFAGAVSVGTGAAVGGATAGAGGLAFPASAVGVADANTLDDYEEGTWTPTDGSGAGLTFTVSACRYTKIGRMVSIQGKITYPTNADVRNALFIGFPFNAADNIMLSVIYSDASVANFTYIAGDPGGGYLLTPGVNVINSTMSGKTVHFSGTYAT